MGVLGKMPRPVVHFLTAATLLGCGREAPPPAALPAEPASVPAPAAAEARGVPSGAYGDPSVPVAGRVLGTVIHTQAEKEAYVAHRREALSKDPAVAAELGEESAEDKVARLEIAEAFIKQWKINRALYQA
jgi:hypothetical protein